MTVSRIRCRRISPRTDSQITRFQAPAQHVPIILVSTSCKNNAFCGINAKIAVVLVLSHDARDDTILYNKLDSGSFESNIDTLFLDQLTYSGGDASGHFRGLNSACPKRNAVVINRGYRIRSPGSTRITKFVGKPIGSLTRKRSVAFPYVSVDAIAHAVYAIVNERNGVYLFRSRFCLKLGSKSANLCAPPHKLTALLQ